MNNDYIEVGKKCKYLFPLIKKRLNTADFFKPS